MRRTSSSRSESASLPEALRRSAGRRGAPGRARRIRGDILRSCAWRSKGTTIGIFAHQAFRQALDFRFHPVRAGKHPSLRGPAASQQRVGQHDPGAGNGAGYLELSFFARAPRGRPARPGRRRSAMPQHATDQMTVRPCRGSLHGIGQQGLLVGPRSPSMLPRVPARARLQVSEMKPPVARDLAVFVLVQSSRPSFHVRPSALARGRDRETGVQRGDDHYHLAAVAPDGQRSLRFAVRPHPCRRDRCRTAPFNRW